MTSGGPSFLDPPFPTPAPHPVRALLPTVHPVEVRTAEGTPVAVGFFRIFRRRARRVAAEAASPVAAVDTLAAEVEASPAEVVEEAATLGAEVEAPVPVAAEAGVLVAAVEEAVAATTNPTPH